jgi:hypothetical protein
MRSKLTETSSRGAVRGDKGIFPAKGAASFGFGRGIAYMMTRFTKIDRVP